MASLFSWKALSQPASHPATQQWNSSRLKKRLLQLQRQNPSPYWENVTLESSRITHHRVIRPLVLLHASPLLPLENSFIVLFTSSQLCCLFTCNACFFLHEGNKIILRKYRDIGDCRHIPTRTHCCSSTEPARRLLLHI